MENQPDIQKKQEIPTPNLRDPASFKSWLDTHITSPAKSFKDEADPAGKLYSPETQLKLTKDMLRQVVSGLESLGLPDEKVANEIKMIAKYLNQEDNSSNSGK